MNNQYSITCEFCGATYSLFTIFNKDMGGLCKAWRNRHEFKCKNWTPEQRQKWAKKYKKNTSLDSALVMDYDHPGMKLPE